MKTKAEEKLASSFADIADRLPGADTTRDVRSAAIAGFEDAGLPHRRIEEWKYTDLRSAISVAAEPVGLAPAIDANITAADIEAALGPLHAVASDRVVFVDGVYRPELSNIKTSAGVTVASLRDRLEGADGSALLAGTNVDDAIGQLNTAFVTDGAVVEIADRVSLEQPLMLVFARAGTTAESGDTLLTTRNVVNIGTGATATIIEAYLSLDDASGGQISGGQTNALTEISVGDGADVSHIKVGLENGATHLATWTVTVGGGADYKAFQYTADMRLVRNQVFARYGGPDAKLDISGAFLGRGHEHIDTTLVVTHEVVGCQSRELFKGVLDDDARGVFQGKVIVHPEAQKTDGKQMAQVLMLSEACEFDSKPELEIYADDVACGHGSTCAEIDPDLVFYCRSRGIDEATARGLLIESFVAEAIEQVENSDIAAALGEMARGWLIRSGATASQ